MGERPKNVTFLLDAGVCINQRDVQGRTPLMISGKKMKRNKNEKMQNRMEYLLRIFFFFCQVYRSNLDILSILLNRGADVNTQDDMGFTALQIAILCRKRDAAIMLIERGSDMSVVTPLTKASIGELCRTCMPKILRCLEPETRTLQ